MAQKGNPYERALSNAWSGYARSLKRAKGGGGGRRQAGGQALQPFDPRGGYREQYNPNPSQGYLRFLRALYGRYGMPPNQQAEVNGPGGAMPMPVQSPGVPFGMPWQSAPVAQPFPGMPWQSAGAPTRPVSRYQMFLQALQERRDARGGVPMQPPQGAMAPSAQRRPSSMQMLGGSGSRSF